MTDQKTGSIALLFATVFGVLIALGTSLQIDTSAPGSGVVIINDQPIEQAEFDRALVAIANDKRNPLTEEDRERVLSRLIEEELLIQRGVEIGLVDRDLAVRSSIVTAVIDHILTASRSDPISEDDLRQWYADNADRFRSQPLVHLRDVSESDGLYLPNGLVPASTLLEYVGPTMAALALETDPGTRFSDQAGRMYLVVARAEPILPLFEDIREDIEVAFRRDAGDAAFREYLDWLERRAEIERPNL